MWTRQIEKKDVYNLGTSHYIKLPSGTSSDRQEKCHVGWLTRLRRMIVTNNPQKLNTEPYGTGMSTEHPTVWLSLESVEDPGDWNQPHVDYLG